MIFETGAKVVYPEGFKDREGEPMARPLKAHSQLGFHPVAAFFWFAMGALPGAIVMALPGMQFMGAYMAGVMGGLCVGYYALKMKSRVVDDLVVNMVDVGEETGELDTMLYKVADTYDEEVRTLTEGLTKLMEPVMIVFLGVAVGFIVISLFLPLVEMIQGLTGG